MAGSDWAQGPDAWDAQTLPSLGAVKDKGGGGKRMARPKMSLRTGRKDIQASSLGADAVSLTQFPQFRQEKISPRSILHGCSSEAHRTLPREQGGRELGLEDAKGTQPRAGPHQGHRRAGPGAQLGAPCDLYVAPNTPAAPSPAGSRRPAQTAAGEGRWGSAWVDAPQEAQAWVGLRLVSHMLSLPQSQYT